MVKLVSCEHSCCSSCCSNFFSVVIKAGWPDWFFFGQNLNIWFFTTLVGLVWVLKINLAFLDLFVKTCFFFNFLCQKIEMSSLKIKILPNGVLESEKIWPPCFKDQNISRAVCPFCQEPSNLAGELAMKDLISGWWVGYERSLIDVLGMKDLWLVGWLWNSLVVVLGMKDLWLVGWLWKISGWWVGYERSLADELAIKNLWLLSWLWNIFG